MAERSFGILRFKSLAGAWLASAVLVGLSVIVFGAAPSGPGLVYVGYGADPQQFIWFLNWFPFAFQHHLDLFWTQFVAAPTGMSLAWRTSIPALGLVAAPFTLKYGALAAYNDLMRIAPGLAGVGMLWAARELTGRTLSAFIAGLVFGFSTYEMGQSLGHLNLTFTLAVPLLVWAVLRATRRDWSPGLLALVTGVLFAFQFGVSQEIAASFLLFAALAACWLWVRDPALRPVLSHLAPGIAGGLAVALLLGSPLLSAMLFDGGRSGTSIASPADFSTDLLNFVVPTPITLPFGHLAAPLAHRFKGNFSEEAGYLGLPLILLLVWIGLRNSERKIRLPLEFASCAAVLSLGPVLHVAGSTILPAPWAIVSWLPVLDDMLPARFMLYAWLALALGLAAWLGRPQSRRMITGGRLAAVVGALAFCMPSAAQVGHWTRLAIPSIFVAHGRDAIPAGASVFILPFVGNHIGAQYASGLRFRLVAQGYLGGGIVRPFSRWKLITPLYNNQFDAVDRREFTAFLSIYGVHEVLVERDALHDPGRARNLLAGAGWRLARSSGSVSVYLPPLHSAPPAVLAQEQARYFAAKERDTRERRERANVCAVRRIEAAIGLHLAFVWSFYGRHFNLPLPITSISCREK